MNVENDIIVRNITLSSALSDIAQLLEIPITSRPEYIVLRLKGHIQAYAELLQEYGLLQGQIEQIKGQKPVSEQTSDDRERELLSDPLYKKVWLKVVGGIDPDLLPEDERALIAEAQELLGMPGYPVPWDMDPSRR